MCNERRRAREDRNGTAPCMTIKAIDTTAILVRDIMDESKRSRARPTNN